MASEDPLDPIARDLIQTLSRVPRIVQHKLQSRGISGMQAAELRVLGVLSGHGSLPISEIGKRLFISKPYMTRLIDHLESGTFVERIPDTRDRRVINVLITKAGMEHLRSFHELFRDDIRAVLSGMEKTELHKITDSIENIRRILDRIDGL
ncbi:MAG: MarR family transcriptional regulator [Methanoregulaceae archaeon]|nr:MarR family transcriptional regulator [Methanoregulaceae archaeon]